VLFHRSIIVLLFLLLAGCRPGSGGGDEQKEPYFLAGKNRLQSRDYQGAIEMFEKALDVNPRSASAHFELGILYEQQQGDYPAALYHYQKAVTLRSDMLSADLARQRIQECKRELAKSVVMPVSTQNLQKTIDELRADNQVLKQQLQAWQTYYGGRGVVASNGYPPGAPVVPPAVPPTNIARVNPPAPPATNTGSRPVAPIAQQTNRTVPPASSRLHTVASGETLTGIARRYRISPAALQSANPTVDAKRMRPGQALVIPAR
jgi:LysM repeat protein